MDIFETILARRSVRSYCATELDHKIIGSLLEAAVRAPTAVHEEPWAFVIIQDRQLLNLLSERAKPLFAETLRQAGGVPRGERREACTIPDGNIFHDAGTLIVICAKPDGPFVTADCWLAAENLMLAACAMGLGTCVIGSALPALDLPEIKTMLGIPREFLAVAPIIVGYPQGNAPVTSRQPPRTLAWH